MEKAFIFLAKHKDVAFATIEGDRPKIRVFQIMKRENNTLYFATAPHRTDVRRRNTVRRECAARSCTGCTRSGRSRRSKQDPSRWRSCTYRACCGCHRTSSWNGCDNRIYFCNAKDHPLKALRPVCSKQYTN